MYTIGQYSKFFSLAVLFASTVVAGAVIAQKGSVNQTSTNQHPFAFWPSFRLNSQNQGFLNMSLSSFKQISEVKSYKTDGLVWSTPVFDSEGNIYVGSADKHMYALTPNGQLIWKYKIFDLADSLIDSASLITKQGNVIVPGGDGFLHALNKKTGKLLWSFKAFHVDDKMHASGVAVNSFEGNVTQGPTGLIYAGSDNGAMYAIEEDGNLKWSFQTNMMIWSSPAFHPKDNWMVFGSLDGFIYLLNAETGELLDKLKTTGEVKASPAIDDEGTIYAGSSAGTMYALQVIETNGSKKFQLKWNHELYNEIYSSVAVKDSQIFFGVSDGNFVSFDKTGKRLWTYFTSSRILSSPVVTADNVVIFGARNGKIYALNTETGHRIWSYKTTDTRAKSNLDSSVSIGPTGKLAVGSYNGNIFIIDANYCLAHKTDPNCEFEGTSDHPDFGSVTPENGSLIQFEDRKGNWLHDLKDPVGLSNSVRFKLLAFEKGNWVENASINPLSFQFKIEPKFPVDVRISGDGRVFTIMPQQPFPPNQKFKITVKGNYFHQTHWFLDRWKWLGLIDFEGSLEFETTGTVKNPKKLTENHEFGIDNMFLFQPEALETYTPAAIDGQVFWVRIFSVNEKSNSFLAAIVPVTKSTNELKILYEPSRSFVLSGVFMDRFMKLRGAFKIAAMGGEIPFEKSFFHSELDDQGLPLKGEFVTESPCWGLRGSGNSFQFPMQLADLVCDHLFYMTTNGKFESFTEPKPKDSRSLTVETSFVNKQYQLVLKSKNKDEKLVQAVLVDEDGNLLDHTSVRMQESELIKFNVPYVKFKTYVFENAGTPLVLEN
jgi:outer membrane protein assembly factor BamB